MITGEQGVPDSLRNVSFLLKALLGAREFVMPASKAKSSSQPVLRGVVTGHTALSSQVEVIAHECIVSPTTTRNDGQPANELQLGAFNACGQEGDKGRLWAKPMQLVQQMAERIMHCFAREAISTWDGEALPDGFEDHMAETARLKFGKPLTEEQQASRDEIADLKAQIAAMQAAQQVTTDPNA